MTTKKVSIGLGIVLLFGLLFWLPWFVVTIWAQQYIVLADDLAADAHYDAALVFGGLVREGAVMSETNKERLYAAGELFRAGDVGTIVISNTEIAAGLMREGLVSVYPEVNEVIELDTGAVVTSDTCKAEIAMHSGQRSVMFISHAYHLPRILLQCHRLGLEGDAFVAESFELIDREDLGLLTTAQIRYNRHAREAFFIWLNLLGIYT